MPSVLVTDARHIDALDAALPAHLDAVVNNAGVVVATAVLPKLWEPRGRVIFIASVEDALTARNPKARCLVGLTAKVFGVPGRA